MNIPVKVIINDSATQNVRIKIAKCDPHRVATRVVVPLARFWRNHLAAMPRNVHGWPSTGFWEEAARRVIGVASGPTALLSSDKIGLRKRYYGGTTKAVNVENVTIPVCAEAYGTTVKDWGRENLVLVVLGDGRKFFALWLGGSTPSALRQAFKGTIRRAEVTQRRVNQFRAIQSTRQNMFAHMQQEKPDVIVFKRSGGAAHSRAERHLPLKFLFRLMHETGPAAPNPSVVNATALSNVARDAARKAVE
jgi:hypothetical protein